MLLNSWGLNKRLKKGPAGHPERNIYRLVPLSTPVNSRRTVPLRSGIFFASLLSAPSVTSNENI
jgi:hypothetical protein